MVCAKKADSGMIQVGAMGLGVGLDINSKGNYIGHVRCNSANTLGAPSSMQASVIFVWVLLWAWVHLCASQECRGVNNPQDNS